MTRIAIIQHAFFDGPARISDWLALRGMPATLYRPYTGSTLPHVDTFDLLILLSGPMQVDDDQRYVWLAEEKQLIREALDEGKRILGIGLGGQLLAQALGAEVKPMEEAEIGWWPLEKLPDSQRSPLGRMLPQRLMGMHWHTHRFALPEDAVALYRSAACDAQGFIWQERAVALQCGMNSTPSSIESWLNHATHDLERRGKVQDAQQIRENLDQCRSPGMPFYRLLDYLTGPHALLC